MSKATPENVKTRLTRVIQRRIIVVAKEIRNFENNNNMDLGPIARQNFSVHQARQQAGKTFDAFSNDNNTRK